MIKYKIVGDIVELVDVEVVKSEVLLEDDIVCVVGVETVGVTWEFSEVLVTSVVVFVDSVDCDEVDDSIFDEFEPIYNILMKKEKNIWK